MTLLIGNDQILEIEGLRDPVTDTYVNNAVVEATMKTANGQLVDGQTWPLVLDYVPSSDGHYQGVLEESRVLAEGVIYFIELAIDAGGDLIGFYRWHDTARYREPGD